MRLTASRKNGGFMLMHTSAVSHINGSDEPDAALRTPQTILLNRNYCNARMRMHYTSENGFGFAGIGSLMVYVASRTMKPSMPYALVQR